jgi:hypothetical protein
MQICTCVCIRARCWQVLFAVGAVQPGEIMQLDCAMYCAARVMITNRLRHAVTQCVRHADALLSWLWSQSCAEGWCHVLPTVITLCLSHVPQVPSADAALSTELGMAMNMHVTLCFIAAPQALYAWFSCSRWLVGCSLHFLAVVTSHCHCH